MEYRISEKILVTGASGFIGTHLVEALLNSGYAVRAAVRDRRRMTMVDGAELFECDLAIPSSLVGIDDGVDGVIHCAGLLGKWGRPDTLLHRVNVEGSLLLLNKFRDKPIRCFLHVSAGGVTGPVAEPEVDETYPCAPVTPYEKTKYAAEKQMLAISREWGVPLSVVRPTFTYGPTDPHKLPLFKSVQSGRFVFIGQGQSVTHPVYLKDLLVGIILAYERGSVGETYIIGGERPVTKKEMIFAIADALEVKHPWISIPEWLASRIAFGFEIFGRLGKFEPVLTRHRVLMMSRNFGYSINKARDQLGYRPMTNLRDGMDITVRYYRQAGKL